MAPSSNSGWMSIVPIAVLAASLSGSMHCVAMCGGLVTSVARTKWELVRYHLGRLLGYSSLGALAGFLGEKVFSSAMSGVVPWIATIAFGFAFIWMGLSIWRGNRGIHFSWIPAGVVSRLFRGAGGSAFFTGLFSAFLPCGWLHSFVLGAVATRNAMAGAAFLFVFWLGTLPALSIAPVLVSRILSPIAQKAPRVAATLLIAAGVFSIGYKASALVKKHPSHSAESSGLSCHEDSSTESLAPQAQPSGQAQDVHQQHHH